MLACSCLSMFDFGSGFIHLVKHHRHGHATRSARRAPPPSCCSAQRACPGLVQCLSPCFSPPAIALLLLLLSSCFCRPAPVRPLVSGPLRLLRLAPRLQPSVCSHSAGRSGYGEFTLTPMNESVLFTLSCKAGCTRRVCFQRWKRRSSHAASLSASVCTRTQVLLPRGEGSTCDHVPLPCWKEKRGGPLAEGA